MDSTSTFSALPVSLQLKILKQLDWTNSLHARLVCADWYQFINYLKPPKFLITDKVTESSRNGYRRDNVHGAGVVLPCLMKSYYEKIGTLKVQDMKTPLPITSSNRMLIPRAEKLVLGAGNTPTNVQTLLRYYAGSSRTLSLRSYCLETLRPGQLNREVHWNQMTRLVIKFDLIPDFRPHYSSTTTQAQAQAERLQFEEKIKQHVITLGAFLASVRLQNLRCLELRLIFQPSAFASRWPPMTNNLLALTKFSTGLESFMEIHGPRLTEMEVFLPCLEVMNSFKHTGQRLKSLKLSYILDQDGKYDSTHGFHTDPRLAFSCFQNLVDLRLIACSFEPLWFYSLGAEETKVYRDVTSLVVANNKRTLRRFEYVAKKYHPFFGWLISDLKLEFLKVYILKFDTNTFPLGHKLEQLKELSISFTIASPAEIEWSPSFFRWIRHTMPAIQRLRVQSWSRHLQPIGPEVRTLVESSLSLRRIHITGVSKPISDEVEEWIASTGGRVEGKWLNKDEEEYEIKIPRP